MRIVLTEKSPGNFEVSLAPTAGDDPSKIPSQAEIGLTLIKVGRELLAAILTAPKKPEGPRIAIPGQDTINKLTRGG